MVFLLAGGIGVPVASAVLGADAIVALDRDVSRVKLRATGDDAVAVSVDVARFHDSAALAIAAALLLAVPKKRGRPRKRPRLRERTPPSAADSAPAIVDANAQLGRALGAIRQSGPHPDASAPLKSLVSLTDAGVDFVVVGPVAAAFRGASIAPPTIDIVVSTSGAGPGRLSSALNAMSARPRGVEVRDGFAFDSALIRSHPVLALRVGMLSLNVFRHSRLFGDYGTARESAVGVVVPGGRTIRIGQGVPPDGTSLTE